MAEQAKEKKVEYLELIYDLIFVYIIGRNNSLLQHTENGFVSGGVFLGYLLGTLAIIQIWNYSTFYTNQYGRNGVRDHIFLCINMFLLYLMADGTRVRWQSAVYQYSAAWALILINIGAQHVIELRNHRSNEQERRLLKRKAAILFAEAGLVAAYTVVYAVADISFAYAPILFGVAAMLISGRKNKLAPVDFAHLSERAMLYVVFTFGEMIIAIASYFGDGMRVNDLYFAGMAFLIAVGLFLSYGALYNRAIDRETTTDGTGYMLIHIFLILALNNISAALEFMREETVALWPKTLFLTGSFLLYFFFLFLLGRYFKRRCAVRPLFILALTGAAAVFTALMLLLRERMALNIAVSAAFVFGVFLLLRFHVAGAQETAQ